MQTDNMKQALDECTISEDEIKMVKKIAAWAHKVYCGSDMKTIISVEDLYHTGIIGLLESRRRIDPTKNPEAYAAIRVRGSIMDALRSQLQVRVPKEQWRKAGLVRKAAVEIANIGGRATPEAIADHLGWPVESVHKARAVTLRLVHADPGKNPSNREETFPGEILPDPSPTPEKSLLRIDLAKAVQECMEGIMNHRDRIIMLCRLINRLELKMLARVMRLSIEGVRQKELRARDQVKKCLELRGWGGNDIQ